MGKILYEANTRKRGFKQERVFKVLVSGWNLVLFSLFISVVAFAVFVLWGINYTQLEHKPFIFVLVCICSVLNLISAAIFLTSAFSKCCEENE